MALKRSADFERRRCRAGRSLDPLWSRRWSGSGGAAGIFWIWAASASGSDRSIRAGERSRGKRRGEDGGWRRIQGIGNGREKGIWIFDRRWTRMNADTRRGHGNGQEFLGSLRSLW